MKGNAMHKNAMLLCSTFFFVFAFSAVYAGNVMKNTMIGGMHIELHVMAAEPFFSKEEVAAKKITEGMLIIGGAQPTGINAESHPNHHLVIHIYDVKTGKAITNAKVRMKFLALGDSSGHFTNVPVVVMQVIGKGAPSTHYGNNVTMPNGSYVVAVVVNKQKINFSIALSDSVDPSMKEMDMH